MRIIPKKIKVRNTVWKCYSMPDVIVALVMFAIIFVSITSGNWVLAIILGLLSVVMFMPTSDGIFYTYILENLRFVFSTKRFDETAEKDKERIDALIGLKDIKENGLLEYMQCYGRVIKVGQKNFGIEDVTQQNIDINYFANALKQLDGTQEADIVKIDRPVTLDKFSAEIFEKLLNLKESEELAKTKEMKTQILQERIDRVDKLNNVIKQYISDYYIVLYGNNELDLENLAINVASEIGKCGLDTKLLNQKEVAVFLKYSYLRNFDEREVKNIPETELLSWVKPKTVEFKSNKYVIDGV